jgi:hypothetical protein
MSSIRRIEINEWASRKDVAQSSRLAMMEIMLNSNITDYEDLTVRIDPDNGFKFSFGEYECFFMDLTNVTTANCTKGRFPNISDDEKIVINVQKHGFNQWYSMKEFCDAKW